MRIAAIDIGSNSTRLLLADVTDGTVAELARESIVTRLGDGVDRSARLADDAIARTFAALEEYAGRIERAGCERVGGVATSAVREATDGRQFAAAVGTRLGIAIDVIGGDREAELTFLGASSGDALGGAGRELVIDIGGGSTELIVGADGRLQFHVSTRLGAVRQSERWLASDPPTPAELNGLLEEAGQIVREAVPDEFRGGVERAIAVAGTPTVLAAVDQALEPFDPWKVHGHPIAAQTAEWLLAKLAALPLEQRRRVRGLHPDRAPTIVAGAAILVAAMRAFRVDQVVVSEHDILYGLALALAREPAS
jgi:exopolyphosphatase/guanosine-5'-triphosphate,3'-diphosphate pyrophosphatase